MRGHVYYSLYLIGKASGSSKKTF